MGAAFNTSLYWLIGHHDGIEARAINNCRNHEKQNNYGDGIDYWSPTVNMQRDPRWGRNQEVPGEDPMLTGNYAANFVQGLQGEYHTSLPKIMDPNHTMILGCCKHFVANSLESWHGNTRHNFDAEVPLRDMADYYLPAFKGCVMEGKVKGIMCSYNAVNGVPMCANALYLNDTLRNSWKFDGYVTSDCDAVGDVYTHEPRGHGYATPENGTALSLKAGTDMDCGDWGAHAYLNELPKALAQGLVEEADLDRSLIRLTKLQMDLGLFDPKEKQPYFNYGVDLINSEEHIQHALEAAQQSIVLLKNDKDILPFKPGQKVAVVGPHYNGTEVFLSNYHGSKCLNSTGGISPEPCTLGNCNGNVWGCIRQPIEAITAANVGGTTTGAIGCDVTSTDTSGIAAAVAVAKAADVVVLTVGISGAVEAEGHDRETTTLPGAQPQLIAAVLALKKPTVLVLIHGGAMSLGPLKDASPAILDVFYGGEEASNAMASVIFGDYNPSGKLPMTMYPPEFTDQVPLTQMSVTEAPGRTHMYYTGQPEFEFGDGLSYDVWSANYGVAPQLGAVSGAIELTVDAGSKTTFNVVVENKGNHGGRCTIIGFWRPKQDQTPAAAAAAGNGGSSSSKPKIVPLRQKMFAFDGILVAAGGKASLQFELTSEHLAVANEEGHQVVTEGDYEVFFKGAQGSDELLHVPVTVSGGARTVNEFGH